MSNVKGPFIDKIHKLSGLTQSELAVADSLTEAWNAFDEIEGVKIDDVEDFRRGIHECQRILATLVVRRVYPGYWVDSSRS